MNRDDVVLAFYPFASGSGGKSRPGLVVQNDADNARMAATILAQITTNLTRAGEPTHLLIEASTVEGQTVPHSWSIEAGRGCRRQKQRREGHA